MISFAGGSIAFRPLCCQQRPTPRTRREQGVPFLVRAPQIETSSAGSVGRSSGEPSGPWRGAGVEEFVAAPPVACWEVGSVCVGVAGLSMTVSGGAEERSARPATKPVSSRTAHAANARASPARRKRFSQPGQKRPLVHGRQRTRSTRAPHSAQKFGLYIRSEVSFREDAARVAGDDVAHYTRKRRCERMSIRRGLHCAVGWKTSPAERVVSQFRVFHALAAVATSGQTCYPRFHSRGDRNELREALSPTHDARRSAFSRS